jgi:hypothetical protein
MLAKRWGKRNLQTLHVGMQINTITMENCIETLQKLKLEVPYDPAIPILGLFQKECKSDYNKGICKPLVYFSTIHNS